MDASKSDVDGGGILLPLSVLLVDVLEVDLGHFRPRDGRNLVRVLVELDPAVFHVWFALGAHHSQETPSDSVESIGMRLKVHTVPKVQELEEEHGRGLEQIGDVLINHEFLYTPASVLFIK